MLTKEDVVIGKRARQKLKDFSGFFGEFTTTKEYDDVQSICTDLFRVCTDSKNPVVILGNNKFCGELKDLISDEGWNIIQLVKSSTGGVNGPSWTMRASAKSAGAIVMVQCSPQERKFASRFCDTFSGDILIHMVLSM